MYFYSHPRTLGPAARPRAGRRLLLLEPWPRGPAAETAILPLIIITIFIIIIIAETAILPLMIIIIIAETAILPQKPYPPNCWRSEGCRRARR